MLLGKLGLIAVGKILARFVVVSVGWVKFFRVTEIENYNFQ